MLARYVWRDLVRNPRRTLASLAGVTLGVGLFSGVLFFIDGSGASMTKRAIAPLALDMQRVLTSPLGGGLRFTERASAPGLPRPGKTVRITLAVTNDGAVPAHEVVINDEAPPSLSYVSGSATLNGRPLADEGGQSPLAQGIARTGLNIGELGPGETARLSYLARAGQGPAAGGLRLQGRISSRESDVPAPANAPPLMTLDRLAPKVAAIPGVAAADRLAFVDLPGGSLGSGGATVRDGARLFAFDEAYRRHYPSIRLVAGSLRPGRAAVSVEAARALGVSPGGAVSLRLPGRATPLALRVGGIVDLSRAKPLFYSRKSSDLEDFLYVPYSVVVDPATFARVAIPAFRAASAAPNPPKSLPLLELDVLVRRGRLHSDPGTALEQTRVVARSVNRVAPGQDYLIDNISNALAVARDDAAVAKRMFVFLGLPGALLAAFLAAFAGSVLASAQRREQANLRIRGADSGHLLRMLLYRTLALAGVGAVLGTVLGLVAVIVILGGGSLFEASPGELALSALIGIGVGLLTTAVALYVPGRRALSREISQERGELGLAPAPLWRRLWLDVALVAVAAIAEIVALRSGAFDAPAGSVYAGQAVSLPSRLLLAPMIAWVAGTLLFVRVFHALASRLPLPAPPRFGRPVGGTLGRSVRRRSWALAGGVVGVGLVIAFGTSLAIFTATYDEAKAHDSRFVVGSDIRLTPNVLDPRPHPTGMARRLRVPGVSAVTPVVFKLENSVVTGAFNQERENLAAIDPAGFGRVAPLAGSGFAGGGADRAMAALRRDPRGLLVSSAAADDLKLEPGDAVRVLFARGTRRQALARMRVAGVFERLPGFPQGVDVVAGLRAYQAATGLRDADFFLARADDPGDRGLDAAVAALRAGPAAGGALTIDTRRTTLDKDQSSLTALNVHGLLDLDSFFTLLMAAAAIAIFVFGLMLQRRREYVTMRAQGMRTGELRAVVLGEATLVALGGLLGGVLVGTGMASLLVHVLRPLFVLDPSLTFAAGEIATLAALAMAATLVSALIATAMLRRLRPTELLRET